MYVCIYIYGKDNRHLSNMRRRVMGITRMGIYMYMYIIYVFTYFT